MKTFIHIELFPDLKEHNALDFEIQTRYRLHRPTNFRTPSGSHVNRVYLYVIDYTDSESEVKFTPSRHNFIILNLQFSKITKISKSYSRM